ncbi:ATP-binding protein [Desulfuromonas sp. CSMB_57]|jgi:serine/threonine-protein kinase RsbW|uniref:ATP-binding protein n=1 Tax=Desulfuromonas sp. CSMB_57 TaxID=2807629 RepID=UPI001CD1B178|nr:ATP-binding protein [Desulfuromonas sp. CSMB_57]
MEERIELDIRVPNSTCYLGMIGHIGEAMARTLRDYHGDREELAYHLNLVLTEATANAMKHGRSQIPETPLRITITVAGNCLVIRVFDQGRGFDFAALPCQDEHNLPEHGRGLFIIRTLMDRVCYRKSNGGHVLEMEKKLD